MIASDGVIGAEPEKMGCDVLCHMDNNQVEKGWVQVRRRVRMR